MLTKSLHSPSTFSNCAIISLLIALLLCACEQNYSAKYSEDELKWLKTHGSGIEVLFGYQAPPNAFHDEDGEYKGLLVDFLHEFEQHLGVSFTRRDFATWNELIEYSKKNKNFVVVGIASTEARSRYLSFTDPFIKVPYVIVSRESADIRNMQDVSDKKICTVANYAINDYLTEHYPKITPYPVSDNLEGLRAVSTGMYDAMILNQMYASYIIEMQGITNLAITGESGYLNRLSAAASIEDTELSSILEKTVDQISPQVKRRLYQKWLGQGNEPVSQILLTTLFALIIVVSTLATLLWIWNYSLNRKVSKRAREVIQSREHYRTTLNSIGEAVITVDSEQKITAMNPEAVKLTGWVEKEALGKVLTDVFTTLDTTSGESFKFPIDHYVSNRLPSEEVNHPTLVSRDDKEFIISVYSAPTRDETGKLLGAVLVFRDITETYSYRQNLVESERKFKSYIQKAPLGICVVNTDHEFLEVNPMMIEVTGYHEEELWLKTLPDLIIDEDRTTFLKAFQEAEDTGIQKMSLCFYHKIGTTHFCTIDLNFIESDKYLLFFRDITKEKKSEEELVQMQKLKSIGTLAGGIAHDFNNILMSLFGNIELARDTVPKKHPAKTYLETASQSLGRATSLTHQLLTFSKGGEPVKNHFNLLELIEDTINFDLAGSSILPEVTASDDLWWTEADKGQIEQVFSNLFINAKQAMPKGGHLYVDLQNFELTEAAGLPLENGNYLKISVCDTGSGIEPLYLPRIFDPYFSTKETGSGLGLASAYSILHKHEGYIQVNSSPGEGTTFTVYLPASEVPQLKTTEAETSFYDGALNYSLLIMDDEEPILKLVKKMIASTGIEVVTSKSGEEAIELYLERLNSGKPIFVAILDLTVPGGMGGKETAEKILETDRNARLIVSSGYSDDPILANFQSYGFIDVIAKPYTKKDLLLVLDRAMKSTKNHSLQSQSLQ